MKKQNKRIALGKVVVLIAGFMLVGRGAVARERSPAREQSPVSLWQIQVGLNPMINSLSSQSPGGNFGNLENRMIFSRNLGRHWQLGLSIVDATSNLYSEDGSIFTVGLMNQNLIRDKLLGLKSTYFMSGIETGRIYWSGEVLVGSTQLLYNSEIQKTSAAAVIGTMGIVLGRIGQNLSLNTELGIKKELRPISFDIVNDGVHHTITHSGLDKFIGNVYLTVGF